jgi:energy-converting hydrogenase Eha subunit H
LDFIGAIDRQYYPIALLSLAIITVMTLLFIKIFIAVSNNEAQKADELYKKIQKENESASEEDKISDKQ